MEKAPLTPIQEAKIHVLSAATVDKHEHLPEFEHKMETAIKLVKQQDPFHEHIGIYNNVLGTERQASIKRKMQLSPLHRPPESSSNIMMPDYVPISEDPRPTERFNYEECEDMRTKCKRAFKEAAENIAYNHGKEFPDYLAVRNKIS
jgi:hypothetical protein